MHQTVKIISYALEANKKGSRVKATIIGSSEDKINLELSEGVRGYLPMKDYINSMSEKLW